MSFQATLSKIDHKELDRWINEKDPKKLHEEANNILGKIGELPEGSGPELLTTFFSMATFLQTRATYFLTIKSRK